MQDIKHTPTSGPADDGATALHEGRQLHTLGTAYISGNRDGYEQGYNAGYKKGDFEGFNRGYAAGRAEKAGPCGGMTGTGAMR